VVEVELEGVAEVGLEVQAAEVEEDQEECNRKIKENCLFCF
jgi:hypothetical protein